METPTHLRPHWTSLWFLPYLWGMETAFGEPQKLLTLSSYRTYEEWKQYINQRFNMNIKVLTVPMRNGNLEALKEALPRTISSYRTYEEWKLSLLLLPLHLVLRSYRTYEEWKPCNSSASCSSSFSSYRTYEEWKHRWWCRACPHSVWVLTVPMRNGNDKLYPVSREGTKFLPYLWGMETSMGGRWAIDED